MYGLRSTHFMFWESISLKQHLFLNRNVIRKTGINFWTNTMCHCQRKCRASHMVGWTCLWESSCLERQFSHHSPSVHLYHHLSFSVWKCYTKMGCCRSTYVYIDYFTSKTAVLKQNVLWLSENVFFFCDQFCGWRTSGHNTTGDLNRPLPGQYVTGTQCCAEVNMRSIQGCIRWCVALSEVQCFVHGIAAHILGF